MYIYLDKQGIVKEIINDEALRQSSSNANEIYVYYDGLQENDIGSVLATYGLPDGTITDEMQVATRTEESEIPYNAERDLKYFQYYKAYPFYHFAIADLALSQEGVVRLMIRLAQKDGEYIKVAGLICFDVEGELVKEDHGVSLAQYNYLVKAWVDTKECLPLDGSKAMRANLDMASHSVLLNGKALKDKNGELNYNGNDLAKQEDVTPLQGDVASLKQDNTKNKSDIVGLQSQVDTINATQNVVDIVGTKAELNAYATKDLHANDKIEVLADESQNNANTIYEWNGNAWSLVGSKAPYYSKAESDARYNELKAKSYDKDTTGYVTGHVPDSGMVKKSLDGISENLETTKIQVSTNKTNIATLQGDVSSLKQDNQTTKTTIAGLVSSDTTNKANIAKNTQDIATNTQNIDNLSAVMPTDINVDNNFNLVLEHDGKVITGQKKLVKFFKYAENGDFVYDKNIYIYNSSSEKFKEFKYIFNSYNHRTYDGGFQYFEDEKNSSTYSSGFNIFIKSRNSTNPYSIGFLIKKDVKTETCTYLIRYVAQNNPNALRSVTLPTNSGTLALTSDLDAKQSTLYRHTIEITKDNEATLILTTESTISTEINTMDKFISAFKGSELACMCALSDANAWNIHYIGIQVGTTLNDTSMMSTNVLDTGMTFTDVFGTSGYTMVDKVKPL